MSGGTRSSLRLSGRAAATFAAAITVALRAPWARIAARVAGSWIAALGLLSLGWLLRFQA